MSNVANPNINRYFVNLSTKAKNRAQDELRYGYDEYVIFCRKNNETPISYDQWLYDKQYEDVPTKHKNLKAHSKVNNKSTEYEELPNRHNAERRIEARSIRNARYEKYQDDLD